MLLVLPLRGLAFGKTRKRLKQIGTIHADVYTLPWHEFRADLACWMIAGSLMAAIYISYFGSPLLTGVKVFLGSLCFGLFGGMLSYLATEKRIIGLLQTAGTMKPTAHPKKVFSVGTKMLFFMITALLFMVVSILLMVFMDINYLLSHKDMIGPEVYYGVFKEILFAFAILLFLSLTILTRYSRNLKSILSVQVEAMENVTRGEYETLVPVVSNDEFGMIAAKTNEMIRGLQDGAVCQVSFGKYVTPEVSELILNGAISPEGVLFQATVLFCDLRGYTPLVEKKDPKEVVKFLNAYFTEMEKAVRGHNGIVLQYIGDEIEAVFGAPVLDPEHPDKAVMAALEMRKRLNALNQEREERGEDPITHGIGIHTGTVLAGSVGSPERLVYAMVGDTVNIASRIQGLNKTFHSDILISQNTKASLKTKGVKLASLGHTPIRGMSQEIEIFKVL